MSKRKVVVIAVLIILIIVAIIVLPYLEKADQLMTVYVAGSNPKIDLYNSNYELTDKITRGDEIQVFPTVITDEDSGLDYYQLKNNDLEQYILRSNTTDTYKDIIQETSVFIRTPATLYEQSDQSSITSSVKKGEEFKITGFDRLLDDGSVNMYQGTYNDQSGYIYSKYTTLTKEEADQYYDYNANLSVHQERGDKYGGGDAGTLDYYPVDKPVFEDNQMPSEVRALYLNVNTIPNIDSYVAFAKENNLNSFVVDIKDNTSPGYASLVMQQYSPTNYNHATNSFEDYQAAIKKLIDNGFYVIGRITVFKDSYYVEDHNDSAIADSGGNPFSHNGSYWPSVYNRDVWEFNIELAKEAVNKMGFHEIQFDYVRFPDRTYQLEQNGQMDMKNTYGESKAQALQAFLMYATDELHQLGVYVSADVFGESAHTYVAGYGQYWPAISNIVDVISAMPYPDHFNKYEYGFTEPVWTQPYELLKKWGTDYAVKRQLEIPTPAIARTWIQAYDAIHDPNVVYDADKISEQIEGLYDAGLTGGYMTWNSGSSLLKYQQLAPAFKREYLNE